MKQQHGAPHQLRILQVDRRLSPLPMRTLAEQLLPQSAHRVSPVTRRNQVQQHTLLSSHLPQRRGGEQPLLARHQGSRVQAPLSPLHSPGVVEGHARGGCRAGGGCPGLGDGLGGVACEALLLLQGDVGF